MFGKTYSKKTLPRQEEKSKSRKCYVLTGQLMCETLHLLCPILAGHHVENLKRQQREFVYSRCTEKDGTGATQ